jgi:signal transduction histidine kinase
MELKVEGLKGLSATTSLSATLKQARLDLPAEIPRNGLLPLDLLQQLRRSALADFLYVALGLSALSLLLMLLIHPPEWQLAALMTVFCALLYRGSRQDPRWHWRVRIFTAVALAACLADVLLSAKDPPAASLVFMPVIIFFVAMLDELWAALLACATALAVVFVSFWVTGPDISNATVLSTEAMLLPSLIAISAATLPIYGALLGQLSTEEAQLAQSLASYRRLMSTFFHDLANPLSVLQILTTLPPALQVPEDALRAQRMAERMDAVAHAALQTLLGSAPVQAPATLGQLGGELYDLFKERLREKGLQWVLGRGANLPLRQSGPLLRDSVLGNLLSNAIKFSPPGSRIELHGWDAGANIHLQLSDTGRGIPPQVLADLAQGRSPASRSGTQGESGSGFGLLLAKAYLAELGGSLTLRARAGGGTEAELTLPKG